MRPQPGRQALRFSVSGIVQGVGFRYSAIRAADRLGLEGWVRNEENGSVSGFAQGSPEALSAYVEWLRRGPAGARVTNCEVENAPVRDGLNGFGVEY